MKVSFKYIFLGLMLFFSGFFLSILLVEHDIVSNNDDSISIIRSQEKKLTNPLLDCELYENSDQNIIPTQLMKSKLNTIIADYSNSLVDYSVYYRDLTNGPWIGINEKALFSPVSLLKVPLMIAYLKKAETEPEFLSKNIVYSGNHLTDENLPSVETLIANQSYSVDELIRRMISLSDNLAFELLMNNIDQQYVWSVHKELNIIYPDTSTPDDYINVKSYAGLFRVLYNSTYLNRNMSEKALGYLLESNFNLGIKAGLPKDIKTALKYGVRDTNGDGINQLHDCGIIYEKKKPYLLCIMTKGKDKNVLLEFIQKTSKIIYESL